MRIARAGIDQAKKERDRVVIIDTAGRLQIDESMMDELRRLKDAVQPDEILLVADGMTGQDAVRIAQGFNDALAVTGVVLTKMDGDARGGAALSIYGVTKKPIKYIGVGEKTDALEEFHPDRMAGRILQQGDVLTLVEKAQETFDADEAKRLEKKVRKEGMDHAAGRLAGTVVFFGTPAEEDVGGKTYMVRDGIFDGVDAVLAWHPADETQADMASNQAVVDLAIEFRGQTAHAAYDPWNARSAVDALELFLHGVNLMREHVRPSSRMHYTIVSGGDVPNVVAEYSKVWLWLRDWQRAEVDDLLSRVRKLAEGAAVMTETAATVTVQGGNWEGLVNETGARLLHANLAWLGAATFIEEEQAFARQIQRATGVPEVGMFTGVKPLEGQQAEGGSTDVGDLSWVVPTLHLSVATSPQRAPWHAWPVVASSGTTIGHKGLQRAASVLAATMVDLYEQPAALAAVQADFKAKKGSTVYRPYIPDGPPPLPKD